MSYKVQTRSGTSAFSIIVETASEAIEKMVTLRDEGHTNVIIKDMAGKIVDLDMLKSTADRGW